MDFEIIGPIQGIEIIARVRAIRELRRLRKLYGPGRRRKAKGIATVATNPMKNSRRKRTFVVCLSNEGYAASLEARKIYVALRDPEAERNGLLRVVDESGDDYLYDQSRFAALKLPRSVMQALASTG